MSTHRALGGVRILNPAKSLDAEDRLRARGDLTHPVVPHALERDEPFGGDLAANERAELAVHRVGRGRSIGEGEADVFDLRDGNDAAEQAAGAVKNWIAPDRSWASARIGPS